VAKDFAEGEVEREWAEFHKINFPQSTRGGQTKIQELVNILK
jgi:hypothetical protein